MSTQQDNILSCHLAQLSDKLAILLKTNKMKAQDFFVGLKIGNWSWQGCRYQVENPTSDAKSIYRYCKESIQNLGDISAVQIQITALDVDSHSPQLDLFKTRQQKIYVNRIIQG